MRLVGLIVASVSLAMAMSFRSHVSAFLNGPSLVLVWAVGLGAVLFGHGAEGLQLLLRALGTGVEAQEAEEAAEVALSAIKSFNCAGILGFIIGGVGVLTNLSDPTAIGPALAIALLTMLYGYGTSTLLWMPTERRMRSLTIKGAAA